MKLKFLTLFLIEPSLLPAQSTDATRERAVDANRKWFSKQFFFAVSLGLPRLLNQLIYNFSDRM